MVAVGMGVVNWLVVSNCWGLTCVCWGAKDGGFTTLNSWVFPTVVLGWGAMNWGCTSAVLQLMSRHGRVTKRLDVFSRRVYAMYILNLELKNVKSPFDVFMF